MKTHFTADEWAEAADKLVRGEVPKWMDPYEKQAFALGVIGEEHIIDCPRCKGEGDHISYDGPDCRGLCMACMGSGRALTEVGKARVKVVFPNYKIRG